MVWSSSTEKLLGGFTTGDVSFLGGTIVQFHGVGTSSSQPIGPLVAAGWV